MYSDIIIKMASFLSFTFAQPQADLNSHTLWISPSADLALESPEQALQAFASGRFSGPIAGKLELGNKSGPTWFLSSVQNMSAQTEFVLSFDFPNLDQIDLWIITPDAMTSFPSQGDHFIASRRFIDSNVPNYKVSLAQGRSSLILYRIQTTSSMRAGIALNDFQSFTRKVLAESLISWSIYGAMMIMAIYHVFLWFSLRNSIYLLYSIFSISGILVSMNIQGQFFQYLIPNHPEWSNPSIFIGAISILLLIEFSVKFLELKHYVPRSMVWLRGFEIALVLISVSYLILGPVFYTKLVMILTLPIPLVLLLLAVLALTRGLKAARYYIIGSLVLLISIIAYLMSSLSILPYSQLINFSIPFGNLIQKTFMALALGDKVKIYRDEAEQAAIERQKETQSHQLEMVRLNASLESKVEEQVFDIRSMLDTLKAVEGKLMDAQRTAKIGSWELDLTSHELTWSPELYRIYEIESSQALGKLQDVARKRSQAEDLAKIDQIVAEALSKNANFKYEQRIFLDSGREKHLQIFGQVNISASGQALSLFGTTQDITDRKLVELRLHESEQIMRFALEGAGDGVWNWHIASGKVQYSKRWKAMLGYAENEISEDLSEWTKRIHPDDLGRVMAEFQSYERGKDFFHSEYRVLCKDESYKWILGRGMVTTRNGEGHPCIMIGTHADISRIKHAEAQVIQASKLASLGEMSAGIAHEICNPLAIISASVWGLPKMIDDPEKFKKKIAAIDKAVERISRIINGLRKYSRSSETSVYKDQSLSAIVAEALILTGAKAASCNTRVASEISQDFLIKCDEVEIEQVLVNLINNGIDAAKYNDKKWVTVKIFEDGDSAVLQVIDSGSGIPEAIRHKIFDPFFTTKDVNEGTGLGLSISKGILMQHNAKFELKGLSPHTCFEIRFAYSKSVQAA